MTLSKLQQEGRKEFDRRFPCLVKPVGYTIDRYGKKEEIEGMTYEKDNVMAFLTAQIKKAYLSALEDVEKGLPLELHTDRLHTLTKEHHVGYNHALSEVKKLVKSLREKE